MKVWLPWLVDICGYLCEMSIDPSMRRVNRGLWIDAKNYADHSSGKADEKTQGTSVSGGETGRIRLPEMIESDFWQLAADAQRVVIQFETLRKTYLSLVEVILDSLNR